jgi:protein phosphatase PTC7
VYPFASPLHSSLSIPSLTHTINKKQNKTKKRPGNDQDEYGFERGSRQAYELAIPLTLGRLVRVEVAQVPPSADQAAAAEERSGTGWFLDRVVVTPPPAGGGDSPSAPITFPCSAWLGSNDEYESRQAAVMARELVPEGACAPTDGKAAAVAAAAANAAAATAAAVAAAAAGSGTLPTSTWAETDPLAAAAAASAWQAPRRPRPASPTTTTTPSSSSAPLPLSMAGGAAAPHRARPVPSPGPALAFDLGAVALPHPDKVKKDGPSARGVCRSAAGWAGEDAYFTAVGPLLPLPPGVPGIMRGGGGDGGSSTLVRRLVALGVSDGVYAWRGAGIDAGAFSRALMAAAAAEVEAGATDPAAVLAGAEAAVRAAGVMGSATACVVLLDPARGALTAANVGDSGFAVAGRASSYGLTNSLTGGEISLAYNAGTGGARTSSSSSSSRVIKFKSPQQEHEFGRPYQLGHHAAADCAGDAMLATLPLAPGDVVVLGSDGLWDNLGDDGLLAALDAGTGGRVAAGGRWRPTPEPPAALARRLAAAAFAGSVDKKGMTPYAAAASAAFNMVYSGGKADDITVVVARVRERRAGED